MKPESTGAIWPALNHCEATTGDRIVKLYIGVFLPALLERSRIGPGISFGLDIDRRVLSFF